MKKISLLQVCDITTGKKDSNASSPNGQYPFFTCAPKPLKIDTYAFDGDVVLLAGNNAGGNFHCNRFKGKFDAYQRTYVLTAKKGYSIDYIYYSLLLNLKQYAKKSQGSQTKFLTMQILKEFEVEDIEYDEQVKIANVLIALDEKIGVNDELIEQLLMLSDDCFSRWFLQYDFPDVDGKPYKSSGGEMVYNESLKKEIPVGWKATNIKEICDLVWGQCPDGNNILSLDSKAQNTLLYCSGAGDMRDGILVDCQAKTDASRKEAESGDILMSIAGSIGAMCICNKHISLGRAALAFRPKPKERAFCYFIVKKFLNRMMTASSGSVQKVINDSHINDINFAYSKDIIEHFGFSNDFIEKCIDLAEENRQLISIRDELMLLLLNGQISVR